MLVNENSGYNATQFLGSAAVTRPRFPDSAAIRFGDGYIGPVLAGYTQTDLSRMAVWRGLLPEGGHGVGNSMNENGHQSAYAAAFSVILADALAGSPDYLRPLHYVMMTQDPGSFFSQPGFFSGAALPICVPDLAAWGSLSALSSHDPANSVTLKAALERGVTGLGNAQGFALPTSQDYVKGTYLPAFAAVESLLGQNYATSAAFTSIASRYLSDLTSDFIAYFLGSPDIVAAWNGYAGFPTDAATAAAFVQAKLGASIYPFAVAEFLVKTDLSAVVDLPTRGGDYHLNNNLDLLDSFFTWSCYKSLMRALAATPLPGGCGESLLDRTLIVHSTEFDRTIARGMESPAGGLTIGANHGSTSTYVLAGYRVNGGSMFGHRMTTSAGLLSGLGSGLGFEGPVPQDPQSGQMSANGFIYTQRALLPTVLNIFDVQVPSPQVTEQKAAPFIVKPGAAY